ncbi:hypothetical protein HHK36_004587 [Tetracentron sinense]|uniref:Vesicle transport protein n=1 Tax=Tetracentron sinense TaxID=13715 RepID=A0A835A0T6_TETSI|nr:hypothetical protein HHK36_004587 [Tetracentron sinense]
MWQSMLVFFNPIKFAITFTFGNLLSLGSTAFLIGPKRQVTMMLDPVRIYATAIYLASIIIALFCALYVSPYKLLTFLAITIEFGALICRTLFWPKLVKSNSRASLPVHCAYTCSCLALHLIYLVATSYMTTAINTLMPSVQKWNEPESKRLGWQDAHLPSVRARVQQDSRGCCPPMYKSCVLLN